MKTVKLETYDLGEIGENELDLLHPEEYVNFRHIRSKTIMEAMDYDDHGRYFESLVCYTYSNGDYFYSNTNVDLDTGEIIEIFEEQCIR